MSLKNFLRDSPAKAGHLAVLVAAALSLGGAWYLQIFGGLFPCPLCLEQRIPWYLAAAVAAGILILTQVDEHAAGWRTWALLANTGLMLWGASIAANHVGVEHQWWGSECTGPGGEGPATIDELMSQVVTDTAVPCDAIQWEMFGITLAGMNFAISLSLAGLLGYLFVKAINASTA